MIISATCVLARNLDQYVARAVKDMRYVENVRRRLLGRKELVLDCSGS